MPPSAISNEKLRRWIAALVLAHFVAALAMAISPQLHELVHHDAGNAGHECLVTTLWSGGTDTPAVAPTAVPVPLVLAVESFRIERVCIPSIFLSTHLFERGPPALS